MKTTPNLTDLPDNTFWRISVKALIFDTNNRLLVFMDKHHEWELPGGGWENGETFEQCVKRELVEEVRATVVSVGDPVFCYSGKYHFRWDETMKWYPKVSIAVRVTLNDSKIVPTGDDLIEVRYVTKEEFLQLPFQHGEDSVKERVEKIWLPEQG